MIKFSLVLALVVAANSCTTVVSNPNTNSIPAMSFHDFKVNTLDGKTFDFASLKGKKVLVVNTASECGYTPQYKGLQELQDKYKDKLVVVGFPCNDFGGQEPGSAGDIKAFCEKNYGVTFPMMEKVAVKGASTHPVYQWLTDPAKNGWNSEKPNWNFCKYLISEDGKLLNFFGSAVKPLSEEITAKL